MPYTTVVAGTTITASWANANVRDQVVTPFASSAARTSAVSTPVEGMVSVLTDEDRVYAYSGSAYQRIGHYAIGGRTGVELRRAADQSISDITHTSISWDAEDRDSDGYIAVTGTTITIPAGLGGLYIAQVNAYSNHTATLSSQVITALVNGSMNSPSQSSMVSDPTVGAAIQAVAGATFVLSLSAADTVVFRYYQNSGGARNTRFGCIMYRLGL